MSKIKTKCPECSTDLRREYWVDENDKSHVTGFCSICIKNFEICLSVNYMSPCTLLKNHAEDHIDENGITFNDNCRK